MTVLLVLTCGAKGQVCCLEARPERLCARLRKDSLDFGCVGVS